MKERLISLLARAASALSEPALTTLHLSPSPTHTPAGAKTFSEPPIWAREANWNTAFTLPRTKIDYSTEVGDGLGSSVLMPPIMFIQRTFPEAPLQVIRRNKSEVLVVEDHAMLALMDHPNDFYGPDELWAGTIFSYFRDGNGYWLKGRKPYKGRTWYETIVGPPETLWYVPH